MLSVVHHARFSTVYSEFLKYLGIGGLKHLIVCNFRVSIIWLHVESFKHLTAFKFWVLTNWFCIEIFNRIAAFNFRVVGVAGTVDASRIFLLSISGFL